MLKLGKLTDYAIAVMAQLARHGANASDMPNSALSAAALAQDTGVPEPTVAKVLKVLARSELLASVRGVSGGYRLTRAPGQIKVGEIIEAMDGPIAIVSCVEPAEEGKESCNVAHRCAVRSKWAPVNSAIRTALYGVTLADMATPVCSRSASAPVTIKPYTPTTQESAYVSND